MGQYNKKKVTNNKGKKDEIKPDKNGLRYGLRQFIFFNVGGRVQALSLYDEILSL